MRKSYDEAALRPLVAGLIDCSKATAVQLGIDYSTLRRQVSPHIADKRSMSVKALFECCAAALARAETTARRHAALAPLRYLAGLLGYTLTPLPAAEPAGAPLESLAEIDVGKGALSRAVLDAIADGEIDTRELAHIQAAIQDVQARLVGLNYDAAAFCAGEQRGVA